MKSTFIDDSEFTTSLNATGTLIVDLVALFHQLVKIPETYVKVCNSIISMVSKTIDHVERVDFVADCYTVNISPIKRGEHIQRGESAQITIKSLTSKTAANFKERILRNPENKTRLIELLTQYVSENTNSVMRQLGCGTIFISAEGQCHKIMIGHTSAYTQLESNQPEADTRSILHAEDALQLTTSDVYIYSPSADTDIIVLAVSLLHDESHRVYIADGSGKGLKTFKLSDVTIDDEELRRKHGVTVEEEELRRALIGLYAFTGNDYASSFFRVGKKTAYTQMLSDERNVGLFSELGEFIDVISIEVQLEWAERFVCQLYNKKQCTSVNEARYEMLKKC